jgi:hypothetical protein
MPPAALIYVVRPCLVIGLVLALHFAFGEGEPAHCTVAAPAAAEVPP